MKTKIKQHLKNNAKFLIIGKDSDKFAMQITHLTNKGSFTFCRINEMDKKVQQSFYESLNEDGIVIGTIKKDCKLPEIIKKKCVILRLKE